MPSISTIPEQASRSFDRANVPLLPLVMADKVRMPSGRGGGYLLPAGLFMPQVRSFPNSGVRNVLTLIEDVRGPWLDALHARVAMQQNLGPEGRNVGVQLLPEMVLVAASLHHARNAVSVVGAAGATEVDGAGRTCVAAWDDGQPYVSEEDMVHAFGYDHETEVARLASGDQRGFIMKNTLGRFGGKLTVVSAGMQVEISGDYESPEVHTAEIEGIEGNLVVATLPHVASV